MLNADGGASVCLSAKKNSLKSTKNVVFSILGMPMGGAIAPHPNDRDKSPAFTAADRQLTLMLTVSRSHDWFFTWFLTSRTSKNVQNKVFACFYF